MEARTSQTPFTATTVVKSSKLLIEHQCPQCGAPAILEETDHLFVCNYCKVKSFLFTPDYFRYMLPFSNSEERRLLFLPYWRFKGSLFSVVPGGIQHRILDVSHQAVESNAFPASLGLRAQAMKLRFVSPETKGYFIKTSLLFRDVLRTVEKRASTSLPKPIFSQGFIGDNLSQIYAPFYADGKLYDAVLNRPVSPALPENFSTSLLPGGEPDWQIQFIPALCPNCGWDLDGERDSLALSCKNCNSIWMQSKKGFARLDFGSFPRSGNDVLYLPFYKIKADVSGIALGSYADLVKIANLPKVLQDGGKEKAFYFWCPAFKIRPQDFLKFSSNVTLTQPMDELAPKLPDSETHPITLPVHEATERMLG